MAALLELHGVSKSFGGLRVIQNLDLMVEEGEIVSLIGPNGAGKTTVFNLVTGVYPPDEGTIRLAGEDIVGVPPHRIATMGAARTFQSIRLFLNMSSPSSGNVSSASGWSSPRTASRMRTAAGSRSRAQWPRSRACSCSTSPRPG
jgi:ABC-type branched-subunit amino acid transport system ATPase component